MWRACVVTAASSATWILSLCLVARRPGPGREFESLERKSGCDSASGQCPGTKALRGLPGACRHRHLRYLARMDVGAQTENLFLGTVDHFELERRAGVIVPDFDRVDPMPMRAFAARQQKENRGGGGAAVNLPWVAEGFAIVPALRVWLESERAYHFGSGG